MSANRVHKPNLRARSIADHENGLEEVVITEESHIHTSQGIGGGTNERNRNWNLYSIIESMDKDMDIMKTGRCGPHLTSPKSAAQRLRTFQTQTRWKGTHRDQGKDSLTNEQLTRFTVRNCLDCSLFRRMIVILIFLFSLISVCSFPSSLRLKCP